MPGDCFRASGVLLVSGKTTLLSRWLRSCCRRGELVFSLMTSKRDVMRLWNIELCTILVSHPLMRRHGFEMVQRRLQRPVPAIRVERRDRLVCSPCCKSCRRLARLLGRARRVSRRNRCLRRAADDSSSGGYRRADAADICGETACQPKMGRLHLMSCAVARVEGAREVPWMCCTREGFHSASPSRRGYPGGSGEGRNLARFLCCSSATVHEIVTTCLLVLLT